MWISTVNHNESYSVYTVLRSFLPHEEITQRPDEGSSDMCESIYSETKALVRVTTEVRYDGKAVKVIKQLKKADLSDDVLVYKRQIKNLIKQSVYDACKNRFGYSLDWGILTGIRPVKVAKGLLLEHDYKKSHDILVKEYRLTDEKSKLILDISSVQKAAMDETGCQDVSLYIAIPFCVSRCGYCSFVSHSIEQAGHLVDDYCKLLIHELSCMSELIRTQGLVLKTIYIGGGTPTSLDEANLECLLSHIYKTFDLSKVTEYTLEAGRADTVSEKKLRDALRFGVNRVCINPQTLSDDILTKIGRRHTAKDFFDAFNLARSTGFENINTDIIAGLPGDTLDGFRKTVDGVLSLSPEGITVHTLSIKRGSKLNYTCEDMSKEAELVSHMLAYSSEKLRKKAYLSYYLYRQKSTLGNLENVGFSKPGFECRYNIYMMEEIMNVFAAGAGAASKILFGGGRIERVYNYKYPYEYIKDFDKALKNQGRIRELLALSKCF